MKLTVMTKTKLENEERELFLRLEQEGLEDVVMVACDKYGTTISELLRVTSSPENKAARPLEVYRIFGGADKLNTAGYEVAGSADGRIKVS